MNSYLYIVFERANFDVDDSQLKDNSILIEDPLIRKLLFIESSPEVTDVWNWPLRPFSVETN
jgi:hypothetical protein